MDDSACSLRPFVDASFEGLRLLRLEYAAAILEAFPGRYVIDFASIRRLYR